MACDKTSGFRNTGNRLRFLRFFLCDCLAIHTQVTRRGFILMLESWNLRIGRNISSHIPPRTCRQLCMSGATSREASATCCCDRAQSQPVPAGLLFFKLLPRKTLPSLAWEIEFSDLSGYFCFVLHIMGPWV